MHYLVFHVGDNDTVIDIENKVGFKGTEQECVDKFRELSDKACDFNEYSSGIDNEGRMWFRTVKSDRSYIKVWLCNKEQAKPLVF